MLITQSGNFQKFKFEFLAGISSNTWQMKIEWNRFYCELHCSSSPKPCSHAPCHLRGRAPFPLPRPEPWEVEGRREMRPGPPPRLSSSLHAPDRHALASTDPQHSAAEMTTPSTPPRLPCPVRPPNAARTPALAIFWSPCPRPPATIKTPVDHSQKMHTLAATDPHPSLFLSPSETSHLWERAPPRSGRLRPLLELLLVRGGGAEPPPSICNPAVKLCFLSVEPPPSNTRLCMRRWAPALAEEDDA
jgi:hypothetical protein